MIEKVGRRSGNRADERMIDIHFVCFGFPRRSFTTISRPRRGDARLDRLARVNGRLLLREGVVGRDAGLGQFVYMTE
jgi:hypothetical protein